MKKSKRYINCTVWYWVVIDEFLSYLFHKKKENNLVSLQFFTRDLSETARYSIEFTLYSFIFTQQKKTIQISVQWNFHFVSFSISSNFQSDCLLVWNHKRKVLPYESQYRHYEDYFWPPDLFPPFSHPQNFFSWHSCPEPLLRLKKSTSYMTITRSFCDAQRSKWH